jgi:hypothetical protein
LVLARYGALHFLVNWDLFYKLREIRWQVEDLDAVGAVAVVVAEDGPAVMAKEDVADAVVLEDAVDLVVVDVERALKAAIDVSAYQ